MPAEDKPEARGTEGVEDVDDIPAGVAEDDFRAGALETLHKCRRA